MASSHAANQPQALSSETQDAVEAFESLETDPKLAVFYYIYEKMGDSITPAAPAATEPELAPRLQPPRKRCQKCSARLDISCTTSLAARSF